jgi:transcriptional regulator with XRE-family HTH domain
MMLKNNIKSWQILSDPSIVREIGKMLRSLRLSRNLTQAQLAERAGLDRSTIVQLEKGRSATILTLIQILRVLEKLDLLDGLNEEPEVSPLKVAKLLEKTRKRATGKTNSTKVKKSAW